MNVLLSPFKNPFINLALEDYFLRAEVKLPILFFYVNRPCVVLGRFQNPWIECNLSHLAESDIWLVRRQSGGGCVFHDEGNINYCFIYPEGVIDRLKGVELLKRAFATADIQLEISARHDLWLNGCKISGSAFKQIKNTSFHHGTFLVNSDLTALEKCLRPTLAPESTKSIPSVRSKVTKMTDHFPQFQVEDVIDLVAHECKSAVQEFDASLLSEVLVQAAFKSLISWEWMWGETPAFDLAGGIHVHKGEVKAPVVARFDAESMTPYLSRPELEKYFPDFTKQNVGQNLIF